MKSLFHLLNCAIIPFLLFFQSVSADSVHAISYEEWYDGLMNLEPDESRVAVVKNLTIKRDVGTFHLIEGTICFCAAVMDRTCAAIFTGKGTFSFTPPTRVEKEQLARFYETSSLEEEFEILFLVFADSTLEELSRRLTFTPGTLESDCKSSLQYCCRFLGDDKGKYCHPEFMTAFLNDRHDDFFYSHFSSKKKHPMFFELNPYEVEEIRFMRRNEESGVKNNVREVISQFHKQDDYTSGSDLLDEKKDRVMIESYRIDLTIEGSLGLSAITEVEFTSLEDDLKWIDFELSPLLEVDSVYWKSGDSADYFKKKDNGYFWFKCDPPLQKGDTRNITMYYHGDVMKRVYDWTYIKSSTRWYPRTGFRRKAGFDITFHYPFQYTLVSVGEEVKSEEKDRTKTSRWITREPIRNASFNIGLFKKDDIEDQRIPPVTVLMFKEGHEEIAQEMIRKGVASGKNMIKQVGSDIANGMFFFQQLYGKCPIDRFYATEIPYAHGEAFPGLIHLYWATFWRTSQWGDDELFRGHEVAHQWWGIGVDFKTYHDQWLSEGFAEYSGLRYMNRARGDNEKFLEFLRDWKNDIMNVRDYIIGSGQESGPVWLGYRTGSSETESDYDLIIYKKGAWILHMLRVLMLDLKTMKEESFEYMMRDFYNTYVGKRASTEDFKRMVDKYTGKDMNWFFDQWVYGTEIPTYDFSYHVEENSRGKYILTCRVEQHNVSDDFRMDVPLIVDFGSNRLARFRMKVRGPVSEHKFALPLEPHNIVFNAFEGVLCRVNYSDWE